MTMSSSPEPLANTTSADVLNDASLMTVECPPSTAEEEEPMTPKPPAEEEEEESVPAVWSKSSQDSNKPPAASTEEETPATPTTLSVNKDAEEAAAEPVVIEQAPNEETPQKKQEPKKVTSSSRKRIPYKYDPSKVTLRFIFANRDGLSVTIDCEPADTVGEVKGALLSVWPKELPNCSGGDQLRLICMGKGLLMPDTRTLEECQVPTFKTHATPVNVSVRPNVHSLETNKSDNARSSWGSPRGGSSANHRNSNTGSSNTTSVEQGCSCVIS